MLQAFSSKERLPVLFMAVGRQRVGKTVLLNTMIQYVREHAGRVEIWNADTMNASHSLSLFHADARGPGMDKSEDVKTWLEGRFLDMAEHRYDAVLDVGGGDTPLARLVEELPIAQSLEAEGIRVVLAHVLGPETADLDYLANFLADERFAPDATLLVMNEGLVLTGRSPELAFADVMKHPAFKAAIEKGAQAVRFPRLACMAEVTDRGLTFVEAMNGGSKNGKSGLNIFDKQRVRRWWTFEVRPFFQDAVPSLWLPEMQAAAE